jgi:hypothetical protein
VSSQRAVSLGRTPELVVRASSFWTSILVQRCVFLLKFVEFDPEVIDLGGQVRILTTRCFSKEFALFLHFSFVGIHRVFL